MLSMKPHDSPPFASLSADDALAERVRRVLGAEPEMSGCRIDVRAKGGTVTLSGVVTSAEMALRAQQLALSVTGVDMVWTSLVWHGSRGSRSRPDS